MFFIRFALGLTIFLMGYTITISQFMDRGTIHALHPLDGKIYIKISPPVITAFYDGFVVDDTKHIAMNGIVEIATLSNIQGSSYYFYFKSNYKDLDSLREYFHFPSSYLLPLNVGILSNIENSDSISFINGKPHNFVDVIDYYYPEKNIYYDRKWFQDNIGMYLVYETFESDDDTVRINMIEPLYYDSVKTISSTVSKVLGTSFQLLDQYYYTNQNTVILNKDGESIPLSTISKNDIVEINYYLPTNHSKNLALKITKLEKPFGILRYSEDIQRISGDTIYTTTHKILKSGITKFQNSLGLETDESSFVKNSAAITFTKDNQHMVSVTLEQIPFALTSNAYNNKTNSIFKGNVIGRVSNQNWSDISLGNNVYTTNEQTVVQLQDGTVYPINQLNLQPNELVRISYFIDNEKDSKKPVVSMVSIIDTTVYTSINNQKNLFGIEVFPHPVTSNQTSLQYYSDVETVVTVTVYSINGVVQSKSKHQLTIGTNTLQIDCSYLQSGSYILEISDNENSSLKSIPIKIVR